MAKRKQIGKGYQRRMADHKREQMKKQARGSQKELEQLRDKLATAGAELVKARNEAAAAHEIILRQAGVWSESRVEINSLRYALKRTRLVWFAYGMGAALIVVGAVLMWRGW